MAGRRTRVSWLSRQAPGSSATAPDMMDSRQSGPAPWADYGLHGGQRLARLILLTVLCGFLTVQMIDFLGSPVPSQGLTLGVGIAAVCVMFVLQLFNSAAAAATWPLRRRLVMLLAQGLATYLPLLVLGSQWAGMAGFFAGSILLLLSGWIAWVLFGAVILSMLAGPLIVGLNAYSVAYLTVASIDIGLVVFGLSKLSLVIRYLNATRSELAQLAVLRERERIARDLHDLLGYSLSAITLKAELTKRLVGSNPARARDELAETLDIARQALADVRIVASGYRNMSLAKETSSVASLLTTAGITATVQVDIGALDEDVDTVLATVLREAMTNVLRHSAAQNCTVEATERNGMIRLLVANDGVPAGATSHRIGGGLENLALRMTDIGGTLSARVRNNSRFEVLATVAAQGPGGGEPSRGAGAGGAPGPPPRSDTGEDPEDTDAVTP